MASNELTPNSEDRIMCVKVGLLQPLMRLLEVTTIQMVRQDGTEGI